jgi:uncharacterized protein (TIGR03435 family)
MLTLAVAAVSALATPIVVGVLNTPTIRAQSTPALPKFEVASIKLDVSGVPRHNVRVRPGSLHTENASVRLLMETAYDLQEFQVGGGPRWIDSDGYNIEAKAEGNASRSQVLLMLQSLLEERFNLKAHRETKELPSYALLPAKGGAKFPSPKDGGCRDYFASPISSQDPQNGRLLLAPCGLATTVVDAMGAVVRGGNLPMTEFIKMLSEIVGKPIIDRTGVLENFDVNLQFYPDDATPGIHTRRQPAIPSGLRSLRENRR